MSPAAADYARLFALQPRQNIFEDIIAGLHAALLRPGDLAVDGGAHAGLHTWPIAERVGPAGRVLAIEPIPELAAALRPAAAARGLPQVEVIEAALADRGGTAEFVWVRNSPGYSGLHPRPYPFTPDIERIAVRTVRLDDLLDGATRPWRFAKLDLEGGELRALQGGQAALARWRPVVVFESGREIAASADGYSAEEFFGFFARMDLRLLDLFGRAFGPALWAVRPMPFYLVAVPEGSGEAAMVARHLAETVARVAQAAG
ncbi:MAG: FkbM family methyltransferase [Acetobacteraceae bacterium]|nr:FkbM family methyltransferase [Acetobacteraceae bacterium]